MFACIISDREDALEVARSFSPRVQKLSSADYADLRRLRPGAAICVNLRPSADETPGFLIDLAGLDRLLGSPAEIARKIAAQGVSRVAVAANPDAAI